MKRTIQFMLMLVIVAGIFTSCEKDDTDFSAYTDKTSDDSSDGQDGTATSTNDTIFIAYNGTSVSVTGDANGYVNVKGADVTVNDPMSADQAADMVLVLSGSTTDGSLNVYRQKMFTIVLNGVSIHNNDGPAINNQCSKALHVVCADGTTNHLTDGTVYAIQTYDQKGTLFSEGQVYFSGEGTLYVTGNYKNAIASDDYITIDGTVAINAISTAGNGIKANDGVFINGGILNIDVTADAARGINCDSVTVITGGDITISTSGNCVYDTEEKDYSSAACIKSDGKFTMSGGTLNMISTGDGGKGINCDADIEFTGGTLVAKTTGDNNDAKPKAIKSETAIIVSGGSFSAKVEKSWACDNGTDSEDPLDHLTVKGTPTTCKIEKKSVVVKYE